MSRSAFCGLSRGHRGELVAGPAPRREARWESGRRQRRRSGRPRLAGLRLAGLRLAGARPQYAPMFTGRLLVTLARLRTGPAREAADVACQAGSARGTTTM